MLDGGGSLLNGGAGKAPPCFRKFGLQEQTGPHSPMEASPSLLGQTLVGTVQTVSVFNPPPTRSISSAFNERAPLRINTLFGSFILFLLSSFWRFRQIQTRQKKEILPGRRLAARLELTLRGAISVPAEIRIPGAGR